MSGRAWRFLGGADAMVPATITTHTSSSSSSSSSSTRKEEAIAATKDSDFLVILAALICALVCVLGLVAVARCAWLRRFSNPPPPPPPSSSSSDKGLKKKVIRSLPTLTFNPESSCKFSECPICLTEFIAGDEIRVLPQCDHGFHVRCIDTWLGSHATCPSCRQILALARCQKCGGGLPPGEEAEAEAENNETRLKQREEENHHHRQLNR